MTKFVVLGSCRFEPYEILAVPNKIPGAWNTDEGYEIAAKTFHPAMDEADVILVYAPDGIGRHTQMDIDYARKIGKTVHRLLPLEEEKAESFEEFFSRKTCVFCESENLAMELSNGVHVQRCKDCGLTNAAAHASDFEEEK